MTPSAASAASDPTGRPVLPTLADVFAARDLLDGVIDPTPVAPGRALSDRVGGPVHLKCENLQRTGSFKVRGAYVRLAHLSQDERARGVVAASAGNHAQGVALAAALLGIRATVFMPQNASLPKVTATTAYGAHVHSVDGAIEEALVAAEEFAVATGAVMIHPFDHADIVAGQGTVGLEILDQVPDVRTVIVPAGGGGLLAGIALAVKGMRPEVKVVGVQASAVPALQASLAAGHVVTVDPVATIADGIAVARPGEVPFALIRDLVDDVVTVPEALLAGGLLHCLERYKVLVEPAGSAGLAAMLAHPEAFAAPAVVVLSGGNVDPLLLSRVLRTGLASAGRFLQLRLWLPDRPGSLAGLLAHLAQQRANIVAVEHRRLDPRLDIDEVEISLQLEMRGPEHCDSLVAALAEVGYRIAVE